MWSEVIDQVFLWSKVKRWRKASKCKSLINKVQVHLVLQKKRKETIVRQSRTDIALLLQNGQLQQALPRVEQLYKDQCRLSAYEQIGLLCQCLTTNVPDVIKQSDLHCMPSEVHVAVSSLIFAASRCGELPELHMLRCFFRKYYGCRIDKDNVQLLPGNLVHHEIKENLCITSVPEDEKLRLISDIANKYTLHLMHQEHHEVSFNAEQKAEVLDIDIQDISSDNSDEGSTQTMNLKTPKNIRSHNTWSHGSNLDTTLNYSFNGLNRTMYESSYTTKTNQGALSAGTSLSETLQIHENSFIYLDEMKVKSLKQQEKIGKYGLNQLKQQSESSEIMEKLDMDKRCSNRKNLPPRSRRLSTGDALAYNQSSMSAIDRRSFDSSIHKLKEQRGNSPSHVHPKLPNYEDVLSELNDIKHEYKQGQSYPKYSFF